MSFMRIKRSHVFGICVALCPLRVSAFSRLFMRRAEQVCFISVLPTVNHCTRTGSEVRTLAGHLAESFETNLKNRASDRCMPSPIQGKLGKRAMPAGFCFSVLLSAACIPLQSVCVISMRSGPPKGSLLPPIVESVIIVVLHTHPVFYTQPPTHPLTQSSSSSTPLLSRHFFLTFFLSSYLTLFLSALSLENRSMFGSKAADC